MFLPANEIVIPNDWEPRKYQMRTWHALDDLGKRRALVIAHRRWGKDDLALNWTAAAMQLRPGTYWHMLPQASQARKAIWDAINPHTGVKRIDQAFPKELRRSTRNNDMFIEFTNGATWQVVGSDNFNSLVGSPPIGIVLSEWALANPSAWAFLRPILLENDGWALFITTPRGRNHVAQMVRGFQDDPTWHVEISDVSKTGVFTDEQLEAERREMVVEYGEDYGNALFEQEYNCSFDAAVMGAYFGPLVTLAEQEGRIPKRVEVNPDLPVHSAWDIGVGDSTAIWCFQVHPDGVTVVDFYVSSGVGVEHYIDWLNERGYAGSDYVPHDAKVKEWGTGKTRVERMIELGRDPKLVPNMKLPDGIQAARDFLRGVLAIDGTKCEHGIEALRVYRRNWDDINKVFQEHPVHDWSSHPADAFRYMAIAWRELIKHPDPEPPKFFEEMTINDLWKSAPSLDDRI